MTHRQKGILEWKELSSAPKLAPAASGPASRTKISFESCDLPSDERRSERRSPKPTPDRYRGSLVFVTGLRVLFRRSAGLRRRRRAISATCSAILRPGLRPVTSKAMSLMVFGRTRAPYRPRLMARDLRPKRMWIRCFCHQPDEIMDCRLASVPFYVRMSAMPFHQCALPTHGPHTPTVPIGLLLGDLPVEIPAGKIGQLGREQPAIALNITPMVPRSGSSIVDLHPFPQDGCKWTGRRQEKPRPGFGGGVSRRAALRAGLG